MSVQDKYRSVLNLGEELGVKDGSVQEVDGRLEIRGTAKNQYHKNLLWDEIKKQGGENPNDLMANIQVEQTDHFAMHTVERGDTLGKIADKYYGKPMMYTHIFNANTDILKNPDVIHPGQELTIPNPPA